MSMQHRSTTSHHSNSAQNQSTPDQEYNKRYIQSIHWRMFFMIALVVLFAIPTISQGMHTALALHQLQLPETARSQPFTQATTGTNNHLVYLPFIQTSGNAPSSPSANLLENGSFEAAPVLNTLPNWIFTVRSSAAATVMQDRTIAVDRSAAARITINQPSARPWDVQLHQRNLPVRTNQAYQLHFWAKATAPRSATVIIQQDSAPWLEYFTASIDLTTNWQQYRFTYLSSSSDPSAALRFSLANAAGTVWIDDVQFNEAAPPTPGALPTPFGRDGNWNLIFRDEFDRATLDQNKWVNCYLWDTLGCYKTNGKELEWYMPENVVLGNGTLQLQGQRQNVMGGDGNSYNYTSGIISSGKQTYDPAEAPRFVFQYGYVEMRAQVPAGNGFWAAFWLLRADRVLPWEIDIFEVLGDQPNTAHLTVHYPQPDGSTGQNGDAYIGPNLASGYHTYAIEWTPERIIWFIDGVERKRETNPAHIPHDPMYLISNLAIGGDWPGPPNDATVFPNALQIDYIRVWQIAR